MPCIDFNPLSSEHNTPCTEEVPTCKDTCNKVRILYHIFTHLLSLLYPFSSLPSSLSPPSTPPLHTHTLSLSLIFSLSNSSPSLPLSFPPSSLISPGSTMWPASMHETMPLWVMWTGNQRVGRLSM